MTKVWLSPSSQNPPEIKQSGIRRDWMDETYKKHAYQCMPVTVANVNGWEIRLKEEVIVVWDGGNTVPRVLKGEIAEDGFRQVQQSIIGMVSFTLGWVIKTEEPYSLTISGSPNYFPDGAVGLSATIPTWWWPDEVQMNWKITQANKEVVFPAGSPICFFTIQDDRLLNSVKFEYFDIWENKEFVNSRAKYGQVKAEKSREWVWSKGIKTGLDADGQRIGPGIMGIPALANPPLRPQPGGTCAKIEPDSSITIESNSSIM
jgi:hypothetical protein